MTTTQDAQIQRRRLRSELRRARTRAGLTERAAAAAMEWSFSKLVRIESGAVGISTSDLRALLEHYGIRNAAEVERFLHLVRASKEQRGWWNEYRELASPQYLTLLAYESLASVIQAFQPLVIPGLLQNEDYAREIIRAVSGSVIDKRVDALVRLRLRRQDELFERPDPPDMVFVIDEAALLRCVGGRDVMRRQLNRLRETATRENVTIDVVPFAAGAHSGIRGPLVILEFADERDEDVLFLENARGDVITRDEHEEIAAYRESFADLRELARTEDLDQVINRALHRMS
jgi:transcriptional regulator with XRE-family HTH domain